MSFYIVRHSYREPVRVFNPVLRHQNPPISEVGRQAAAKLAPYFSGRQIAAVYVSSYLRAQQTAEPVCKEFGLTPILDERLNELDNGLVDDMNEQELEAAYPDVWKAYVARTADYRFPEGETGQEASDRMASFLEENREQHKGENIVAVSHEGLIRICMCHLLGLPVYRRGDFKLDFCGITEIEFQKDVKRWRLLRFNQVVE